MLVCDSFDMGVHRWCAQQTDSGWTVRAAGIYPGHCSRSHPLDGSEADRGADLGQEYYLLSSVEGYTFRNRLVPASEISRELD
jgi:hypothetical protein